MLVRLLGCLSRAKEIDLLGSDDEDIASELPYSRPTPWCCRCARFRVTFVLSRGQVARMALPYFDLARDIGITRCVAQSPDDIPFDVRVMLMGDGNHMVRYCRCGGGAWYGFARLVVRALFEDKYRMVQAARP